ncbi:MAG: hypothetical protein HeimC3_12560 [Candidatus Heimdallarchaeota archaeon LC_3]|nr:MAG: hypothetical protein HeimC3_12560 [Candidatus Heimdallarchaeota archaeon LC_3]
METHELNNWVDNEKHELLLTEAKKSNTTVTRLLLKILDHWITHSYGCDNFVEKLLDNKEYLLKIANYANYEEKGLELLILESLDRGLSLVLTKSEEHLPFALY